MPVKSTDASNGLMLHTTKAHLDCAPFQEVWSPRMIGKPAPTRLGLLAKSIQELLNLRYMQDQMNELLWHAETQHFPCFSDNENPPTHQPLQAALLHIELINNDNVMFETNQNAAIEQQAVASVYAMLELMLNVDQPENYEITLTGSDEYQALFHQLWEKAQTDHAHMCTLPHIKTAKPALPDHSIWQSRDICNNYPLDDFIEPNPVAMPA